MLCIHTVIIHVSSSFIHHIIVRHTQSNQSVPPTLTATRVRFTSLSLLCFLLYVVGITMCLQPIYYHQYD
jgi:hypothetical protein